MQLYSMNRDGSDIKRITYPQDSITFSTASWAPDLRRIAVVWNYSDLRRREYPSLAMADTNGNYLYSLSQMCSYYPPVWSPRGDKIVFTAPVFFWGRWQLYIVGANGSDLVQITNYQNHPDSQDTTANAFNWIDDSTIAVILRVGTGSSGLYRMNTQGSLLEKISFDSTVAYWWADLSPDGTQLAYVYHDRKGHTGVCIANRDGTNQRKVAPELDFIYGNQKGMYHRVFWSPDGNHLAFWATLSGGDYQPPFGEIYTVDRDGLNFTVVLTDSVSMYAIADWE